MCNDQDYYDWMPWDGRLDGELCVLGSSSTIERRKADVCCLNGRDYVREFDFQICQCAAEDFECDYGYQRADGITGPCVRDPSVTLPNPCASGNVTTYQRSRGYRKVAGDVCEGGDESLLLPYIDTCCQETNASSDVDCVSLSSPTNGHVSLNTTTFGSVATYICDDGYRLSGQSMTICQAEGTWSGSTPTCAIVDCGQLDNITSGQNTQPITTYGSSATYSCDSGYTLNGPNSRTCQADGYWSGSEPSCDLVDCGLVVAPTNGVVTLSSTTYLSVATYGCSTGYQLSGQNTQTCQADGTWSGNNPTCDIVDCGTPTTPTNGQANFVSINFTSVVAYSCDSGYVLNGSNSRFCQADGTWSGSEPTCANASTCEVMDCSPLTDPTNGQIDTPSITFGSVATYSCDNGYRLSGQSMTICQADGTWSGSTPTCEIVDCGQLDPITNGQITQPITTYGSSATYRCDSGYTLNGPNSRTCQADGYWSGSEPSCDLVDCGLVVAPTNGVVILSSTTYLSVATYGCSTGYQLSGQNTQTCQADGTWSGNNPTCDILNCSTPTTPTNGQASFVSINFTSVVAYSCDSGYVLNGSNSRFCQSDGTWSGSEPTCANASTCEVMDCSPLTDPTNGQIDTPSIIFGSVATYSCDKGYRTRLSGQSMTICQANGTWSGSTPTCKIVDCGQLDDINNGQMTVSTTTYGSSATYSCNIGYRLNGPATTTCGADGYWSGSLPTCDTGIISNIGEQRSTNTTTSKEEDESSAIAVGVVLMLVIIAVAVLLLVNVVFFRKYYSLRKKWYAVRPVRDQQEENQYSYWKLEHDADAASLKHQEAMNSGGEEGIHMDPATAKVQYMTHK